MGLFGLLSTEDFNHGQAKMKEEIKLAIQDAIDQLRAGIAAAGERVVARLDELDNLRAERDRLVQELEDLRSAEDAEDVAQNAALADKQSEVDAKNAEIANAEAGLRQAGEEVANIAADPVVSPQPTTDEPGPSDVVPDGALTEDAAAVQHGDETEPPQFV